MSCPGAAAEPLGVPGQQRQVTHEHVERTRDHRPAEWERGRETARRGRSRLASVSGHVRTRVTAIVKRQSTRGREDMAVNVRRCPGRDDESARGVPFVARLLSFVAPMMPAEGSARTNGRRNHGCDR